MAQLPQELMTSTSFKDIFAPKTACANTRSLFQSEREREREKQIAGQQRYITLAHKLGTTTLHFSPNLHLNTSGIKTNMRDLWTLVFFFLLEQGKKQAGSWDCLLKNEGLCWITFWWFPSTHTWLIPLSLLRPGRLVKVVHAIRALTQQSLPACKHWHPFPSIKLDFVNGA